MLRDKTVKSCSCGEVYLKTQAYMNDIPVVYDIGSVVVPALFGLDVLDAYGLFAYTINNRLINAQSARDIDGAVQYRERWSIP